MNKRHFGHCCVSLACALFMTGTLISPVSAQDQFNHPSANSAVYDEMTEQDDSEHENSQIFTKNNEGSDYTLSPSPPGFADSPSFQAFSEDPSQSDLAFSFSGSFEDSISNQDLNPRRTGSSSFYSDYSSNMYGLSDSPDSPDLFDSSSTSDSSSAFDSQSSEQENPDSEDLQSSDRCSDQDDSSMDSSADSSTDGSDDSSTIRDDLDLDTLVTLTDGENGSQTIENDDGSTTYLWQDDDLLLNVNADEGTFDQDTSFDCEKIDADSQTFADVMEYSDQRDGYPMAAWKMSFTDEDGNRIEPSSSVHFQMAVKPSAFDTDADLDPTVFGLLHLQKDEDDIVPEKLVDSTVDFGDWAVQDDRFITQFDLDSPDVLVARSMESGYDETEDSDDSSVQPLYCYGMLPGYQMMQVSGNGEGHWVVAAWRGMAYTTIKPTYKPGASESIPVQNIPEGVIQYPDPDNQNFFPDITFNDRAGTSHTYKYARPDTPEVSELGYYTIRWIRVMTTNKGAYPPVPDENGKMHWKAWGFCYHLDGVIILNSLQTCTVSFNVLQPGAENFSLVSAQTVRKGTWEQDITKPKAYIPGDEDPESTQFPQYSDYYMTDWYNNKEMTELAEFDDQIVCNTSFYATFKKATHLIVTNEVYGDPEEKTYPFTYQLTIPGKTQLPDGVEAVLTKADGSTEVVRIPWNSDKNTYEFQLEGGESLDLPTLLDDGQEYEITQDGSDGMMTWIGTGGSFKQTEENAKKYENQTDPDPYEKTKFSDGTDYVTFFNEILCPLSITEKVSGNDASKNASFTMQMSLDGNMDQTLPGDSIPDEMTYDPQSKTYQFTMKNGQTVDDIKVPYGTTVSITETDTKGYTVSSTVNGKSNGNTMPVHFVVQGDTKVVIDNDKNISPPTDLKNGSSSWLWLIAAAAVLIATAGFFAWGRRNRLNQSR